MKFLLTSNGCPHCKKAKEKFKEQLKKGEIEELPVNEGKGFELAEKLNVRVIPTLVECEEDKCKILDF